MSNENLRAAKKAKNDEFYTRYEDIELELQHYKEHLKGKWVYCNCDTINSNFWKYFYDNFHKLELKHLTITGIDGMRYDYDGVNVVDFRCISDCEDILGYVKGDFRSLYCVDILKKCDVVITNPPFSLFREYMDLMFEFNKKFLVVGNLNAVTYSNVFPHIKDEELWLGVNKITDFANVDIKTVSRWFTNLWHGVIKEMPELTCKYTPEKYPKYDNYDAINVDRVCDIPIDYKGVMGVPISFMDNWSPSKFQLISFRYGNDNSDLRYSTHTHTHHISASCVSQKKLCEQYENFHKITDFLHSPYMRGGEMFKRIIIRLFLV